MRADPYPCHGREWGDAVGSRHLRDDGEPPAGVLPGSGELATELDRLDLIDEYKFLLHPRIAGHGPTLYQGGLPGTRRLELVAARPLRCGAVVMHYRRALTRRWLVPPRNPFAGLLRRTKIGLRSHGPATPRERPRGTCRSALARGRSIVIMRGHFQPPPPSPIRAGE